MVERRSSPRVVTGTLALALAAFGCGGTVAVPDSPGGREGDGVVGEWVISGGRTRTYALHVPASYDASRPAPLVVAFHGANGSRAFGENAGLNRAADRRGFVVVSPDGIGADWALGCGGCTTADRQGVDDLLFFDTLISQVAGQYSIDRRRVYATGFSDGGTFSYRLACQRSQAVSAVAVVSGLLLCRPQQPLPVLGVHGTADAIIDYTQGALAVQHWAELDGCRAAPLETLLPDRADDGTRVTRYDFEGCRGGTEVGMFAVRGGGHNWPGALNDYPSWLGIQSRQIDASEEIMDFFSRHPAP